MSRENVEVVRRLYEAFERGDTRAVMAAYDPKVEVDLTLGPDGRVYHGLDGLKEAIRSWMGTWDQYESELERLIDAGDRVVTLTRHRLRGKGSELALEQETGAVWTLRDGKIVELKLCPDRAQALDYVDMPELDHND